MNKNILKLSLFAICGVMTVSTVFAAPITQAERSAAEATLIAKQKSKATIEIDRRITSLDKAVEKINATQKITAEQKNTLVAGVQAQITSLQQLKDKIAADTDKAVLLNDRKAIVQEYRTFALFEPRIAIIAYADKILNVADLMDAKTTDADVKVKIADAKSKAQKAIADVSVLTPDGYPGNKSILTASRDLLTSARQELNEARVVMKQAVNPAPTQVPSQQ